MGRIKYTEEQRNEAKMLYEEKGPHAAGRALEIPVGTISAWAHDYGWQTVATEKTKEATEAAQSRAHALRAELSQELMNKAAVLIERLDEETPAKDARELSTAIGILIDKARLELGEATSRSETIDADRLIDDAERRAEEKRSLRVVTTA